MVRSFMQDLLWRLRTSKWRLKMVILNPKNWYADYQKFIFPL